MNQLKILALAALLTLAAAVAPPAQEGGTAWEIFGSQTIEASATLASNPASGFLGTTRLGLEYTSQTGPGFRAEGHAAWSFGIASMEALAFDAGIATAPSAGALPPGTDLHRTVTLDQAYAKFSLGKFDGQFGLIPVAWGSAYVFNPSARSTQPGFPGMEDDTVPGRAGLRLFHTPAYGWSLEAYALAQPRLPSTVPAIDETGIESFPFGFKAALRSDTVDLSVSFSRSLMDSGSSPEYRIGADATGFLGPVTLYAEAAALILDEQGGTLRAFEPGNDIDACAGLAWLAPLGNLSVRAEFAWLGAGTDDVAAYDYAELIRGAKATLGKAYAFALLEKELNDRFKASAGGLWNIYDASSALLARISWSPMTSLILELSTIYFSGDSESEFGGTMQTGPGSYWDPYIPRCTLSIKAYF